MQTPIEKSALKEAIGGNLLIDLSSDQKIDNISPDIKNELAHYYLLTLQKNKIPDTYPKKLLHELVSLFISPYINPLSSFYPQNPQAVVRSALNMFFSQLLIKNQPPLLPQILRMLHELERILKCIQDSGYEYQKLQNSVDLMNMKVPILWEDMENMKKDITEVTSIQKRIQLYFNQCSEAIQECLIKIDEIETAERASRLSAGP